MDLQLSADNWSAILSAINSGNKFISLDLAACTASGENTGGGLRSGGVFDPVYSSSTGKAKIVNLTLPAPATGILAGDFSNPTFKNFTALKTVSGAGVTSIGNYAFYSYGSNNGPAALTSASFPAAASIGNYAFYGCAALTSASFPVAASIGSYAFQNCAALTSASFPAATSIGTNAFQGCTALTSVTMAKSLPLANFNNAGFPGAAKIVWTLAGSEGDWTLEDGTLLIYNGNTLARGNTASGDLTLPGITNIGNYAFYGNTTLTSVSFPAATSIGNYAFQNCAALTSASFPVAASIGLQAFGYCAALTSVNIPAAASIGQYAFGYCAALTSVTLGATPPTLGINIFYGITAAQTVTVRIPVSAREDYGVPNLETTPFDNASDTNSWGRAFKGKGWSGGANYLTGVVNDNITLVFQTYTPE